MLVEWHTWTFSALFVSVLLRETRAEVELYRCESLRAALETGLSTFVDDCPEWWRVEPSTCRDDDRTVEIIRIAPGPIRDLVYDVFANNESLSAETEAVMALI